MKATTGALLVYGAGANQVPVIEAGRRRGWRIVAIDRDPKAPGGGLADRFVCASLRDHETILRAVASEDLRGVVARVTDAEAIESSRRLSALRGLASPCESLVAAATRKRALGALCERVGLRTPRRIDPARPIDFTAGAVCVRPDVTVRGKAAIRRVARSNDLAAALSEAVAASANAQADVSTWIDGADVSVLAVLDLGRARRIALFDEWVAVAPDGRIAGIGAGMPSIFESKCDAVDATLAALARGCPESRCVATLSLRIDDAERVFVIEIHLGVGGDALADRLLPAALPGFDAFDFLVSASAGESPPLPTRAIQPCGLVRSGDAGWRLLVAPDVETLRQEVRHEVPPDWLLPAALRPPPPAGLRSS
ncbi:MAG: hypothetical protein R3F21_03525 [Myxococcota bacterium]